MKFLEPSVIIIDDVRDEVELIRQLYLERGIGCKIMHPIDDEFNKLSNVNIIFLDLYYDGRYDAEACASLIRASISANSFYILIIWTRDSSRAEEVLEALKRHKYTPFRYFVKNKSEYQIKGGHDFSRLYDEIQRNIDEIDGLDVLFSWKNNLYSASNEVLGHLISINTDLVKQLRQVLVSHAGKSALTNDVNYKRDMLFEALDMIAFANTKKYTNEADSPVYDISNEIQLPIDKKLNSWFYFKLGKESEDISSLIAGQLAVYKETAESIRGEHTISDDTNVSRYFNKQTPDAGVIKKDIVVLISRPCDLAQKKHGKNVKLLSGIMLVSPKRKNDQSLDTTDTKPDSVKIYDHVYIDEQHLDVALVFDFRYVFSMPDASFKDNFKHLRIFNKELLSELQVEYASYSSRLGITNITSKFRLT